MKKNVLSLILPIFLIFTLTNFNCSTALTGLTDFTYNSNLVPPLELSWELKKSLLTEIDYPADYVWEITDAINMTQGDIFKITLTEDPNNVAISHFDDLFTTSLSWAEFRLNSDLLGNNASMINFDKIQPSIEGFPITFIYPKTVVANGTEMSVFDYLYEDLKQYEMSTREAKYKITNNEEIFAIQTELDVTIELFFGTLKIDEKATVTYNKEWGVLSTYEFDLREEMSGHVMEAEILLEITDENLKVEVAYEWFTSIAVLIVASLVILRKRKKLSK